MKYIARAVGIAAGMALSAAVLGSGVASADDLTGKTYTDAKSKIADMGGTPVVATVSGSELAEDDCIVTSWQKAAFRDSSGNPRNGQILLNLDCNQAVASPGHPGNSAVSPAGQKAKKDQTQATAITDNPALCDKDEGTMQYCIDLCNRTGLCEYDGT